MVLVKRFPKLLNIYFGFPASEDPKGEAALDGYPCLCRLPGFGYRGKTPGNGLVPEV